MTNQPNTPAIRPLAETEIAAVSGALLGTVSVAGMPSRDVGGCGTMWYLDQLVKIFGPRR